MTKYPLALHQGEGYPSIAIDSFVVGSDSGMRGDGTASICKVLLKRVYTITKAAMPSHSSAAVLVDVPERVCLDISPLP